MLEIIVITEGQTEEQFIKTLVAPILWSGQVFLKPILLPTSKAGRDGAISFERLKYYARNILRSRPDAALTT